MATTVESDELKAIVKEALLEIIQTPLHALSLCATGDCCLTDESFNMQPKYSIEFHRTEHPITEPVTKFGGQPVWLEAPDWPQSRQLKRPMCFIGQIALAPELFGDAVGKMAYIFMTDEEEYVDGTWEANGGENAVVIQPGGNNPPGEPQANGPTVKSRNDSNNFLQPCEFAVTLKPGTDVDTPDNPEENKIGGSPAFLQGEEYPDAGEWKLILQLDSTSVPFEINFGDAGVGYAFLSQDGCTGKFLWQCC